MFRFLLVLPLFFVLAFSWSCVLCTTDKTCMLLSNGSGSTIISLRVPMFHDLKVKERSTFRVAFVGQGETMECHIRRTRTEDSCSGTIRHKDFDFTIYNNKVEQYVFIETSFFYKELYFFIEHEGVVLFDGKIDFSQKPNRWDSGVDPNSCTGCINRGIANITSNIAD